MWIALGSLAALALVVVLARAVRSPRLRRVEREILEEGLPTAPPPEREPRQKRRASGEFRWTEVVNLTAVDGVSRPSAEREPSASSPESSTPAP